MKTSDQHICKLISEYLSEEPTELLKDQIEFLAQNLLEHRDELLDRLNSHLRFGTAGLRGKMEAGYNRMNLVSCYRVAWGISKEIQENGCEKLVVVGYDGRNNGKLFAEEIVRILSHYDFRIMIFDRYVPTPICAFATKFYDATLGIMITASHNPGCDNGVKLFDNRAAQVHGLMLKNIEKRMTEAPLRNIFYKSIDMNNFRNNSNVIGDAVIRAYLDEIGKDRLFSAKAIDTDISIAYTPLHGVGGEYFLQAARKLGFGNIHEVKSQAKPDGNFPTLSFPNPEEEHALDLVNEVAEKNNCSYVFANDPDADRLQVSCQNNEGNFIKLNGNQMGAVLGYFAIKKALDSGVKPLVASSIVSSRMLETMAKKMGALYVDSLTGFSNITDKALKAAAASQHEFVFAYEEAIGFLIGNIVLDKDGINAGARFAEVIGWLKKNKLSIWQLIDELMINFGIFANDQWFERFEGISAMANMAASMEKLRALSAAKFDEISGLKGCAKYDLIEEMKEGPYKGMRADVVIFEIKDKFRLIVRPSGTEPKLKFYLEMMSKASDLTELNQKMSELNIKLSEHRQALAEEFL